MTTSTQPVKRLPRGPRFHRSEIGWEHRETSPFSCGDPDLVRQKQKSVEAAIKVATEASDDAVQAFLALATERLRVISAESEKRRLERENQIRAIDILNQVVGLTTQLFGEGVRVYESWDPEFPDDRHTVFAVESTLDNSSLLAAEQEWISSISQIAPQCDRIRLLISPV